MVSPHGEPHLNRSEKYELLCPENRDFTQNLFLDLTWILPNLMFWMPRLACCSVVHVSGVSLELGRIHALWFWGWQAAAVGSTRGHCDSPAGVLGRDRSLSPLCGVLWWARTRAGLVDAQDTSVRPQSFRLHDLTSTCSPCCSALQEPLQQTRFHDSDTVHVRPTVFCLLLLVHTRTPAQHVFWYRSEAALIYVCLYCLLVFYLIAAPAVWLGLASLTFLNYSCGLQTGSDMVQ